MTSPTLDCNINAPEHEHHIRTLGLRVRERGVEAEIRDMLRANFAVGHRHPVFMATFLPSRLAIGEDTHITVCGRVIAAATTLAPLPWILPIVCRRCLIIWAEEHHRWITNERTGIPYDQPLTRPLHGTSPLSDLALIDVADAGPDREVKLAPAARTKVDAAAHSNLDEGNTPMTSTSTSTVQMTDATQAPLPDPTWVAIHLTRKHESDPERVATLSAVSGAWLDATGRHGCPLDERYSDRFTDSLEFLLPDGVLITVAVRNAEAVAGHYRTIHGVYVEKRNDTTFRVEMVAWGLE